MPEKSPSKPHIIVVALSVDPHRGSEPGKGWWWSRALSPYFHLHIITQKHSHEVCAPEALVQSAGWTFHPTRAVVSTWALPTGYRQYAVWLKEALALSAKVIKEAPIVGLCHITLGSFRMLPRYDTLGIPYTVGPIGGGECAPMSYIWPRPTPFAHKVSETIRPFFNNSFALIPGLRSAMKSAALVLVTSPESERVVQRMGARKTKVVFSDAYDSPFDAEVTTARRTSQRSEVSNELRLLWQGRPLWWKGPDLGLLILRRALTAGVRLQLTMVGSWENSFGTRVKAIATHLQVSSHVRLIGHVAREEFLKMASEHHGFLATSLHDSGGIPLIEAQALGMPCLTPGLGGNGEAACPRAGVSGGAPDVESYVHDSVQCLRRWQDNPETWLEESKAVVRFAGLFTNDRLRGYVQELIVPLFAKAGTSGL